MQRERSPLDWPLLVALCAVTVDLMIGMPAQPQVAPPAPAPVVAPAELDPTVPTDPGLELRAELDRNLAIAFDPSSPAIDVFEALRRARTLDLVLGTGMDAKLTARMRVIAPIAAAEFRAESDRFGEDLARQTADMAGAPLE
jgi:hypothetical protein